MYNTNIQYIAKRSGEAKITLAKFKKAIDILNYNPTRNIEDYIKNQL